jgi:hypothetical protein
MRAKLRAGSTENIKQEMPREDALLKNIPQKTRDRLG